MGADLSKFAPCDVEASCRDVPIESHPLFSKPDIMFRHKAKQPRLRAALAESRRHRIKTFLEFIWIVSPANP